MFGAELRRCREHCDGGTTLHHRDPAPPVRPNGPLAPLLRAARLAAGQPGSARVGVRQTPGPDRGDAHGCDKRCRAHVCKPLAAWTIRKVHYLLRGGYENAIRWEWVSINPMLRARKRAPPAPDPQPPSAEEAAALVSECWKWRLGPFVWLAMTTGGAAR